MHALIEPIQKENKKIIEKLYQKKVEFRENDNDNVYSFQDKKIIKKL